jgi:hypothetical protein
MKTQTFNKENLSDLRTQIQNALNAVAEKNGITLQLRNISFGDTSFRSTIEAKIAGAKAKDYSELYPYLNLPKIGAKFKVNGTVYEVIEHAINRPKYPVTAQDENGKRIKITADTANRCMI